ncbi:MAG: hypothetical protein ACOYBC_08330 [Bilifractor sp.]|jgi:putative membrane protein
MNRNRKWKVKNAASRIASIGLVAVLAAVPSLAVLASGGDSSGKTESVSVSSSSSDTSESKKSGSSSDSIEADTVTQTGTEEETASDSDSEVSKEETVYINADASGNEEKTTVSDRLKNAGTEKNLEDVSDLQDIENVKGDETFTSNGNQYTWKTDGKDIYYQGTTDKESPVSVSLTYYLDGVETAPEKLAGKSGELKIKVQYKNNSSVRVNVDGKEYEVSTPFLMMTALILPTDQFSNVAIDNGRILNDGDRSIVVGYGMPGLKDSLKLSDFGEKNIDEVNINDSFELTADVEDFSMDSTFTIALSNLFEDLNVDDVLSLDDFNDKISEIQDAGVKLADGSEDLYEGVKTLNEKYGSMDSGIASLKSGIDQLASGSNSLSGGLSQYVNGVNTLANGTESYVDGAQKISDAAAGLSSISKALKQVQSGTAKLQNAFDGKGSSSDDLVLATKALASGTKQLNDALKDVDMDKIKSLLQIVNSQEFKDAKAGLSSATEAIDQLNSLVSAFSTVQTQMQATQTAISEAQGKIATSLNKAYASGYSAGYAAGSQAAQNTYNAAIDQLAASQTDEGTKAAIEALKNAGNSVPAAGQPGAYPDTASEVAADLTGIGDAVKNLGTTLTNIQSGVSSMSGTLQSIKSLEPTLKKLETALSSIDTSKLSSVSEQISSLQSSVSQINSGAQQLSSTVSSTLAPQISSLNSGVSKLQSSGSSGISSLQSGLKTLVSNNKKLKNGAEQLKKSGSTLTSGTGTLVSGIQTLDSGAAQLKSGSSAVQSGLGQLTSGAEQLNEGIDTLNEEAIQKVVDFFEGDLADLMDRVKAVSSSEASYDNFSGKAEGMDGSVKFLIETDEISTDED